MVIPRMLKCPSCRSGMAKSASPAWAVVAASSSTTTEQTSTRTAFPAVPSPGLAWNPSQARRRAAAGHNKHFESRDSRDALWVDMTGVFSSNGLLYSCPNLIQPHEYEDIDRGVAGRSLPSAQKLPA